MRLRALVAVVALLVPLTGQAVPLVGHAPLAVLRSSHKLLLSSNWSGYALMGHFTEVIGTFTVPPCDGQGYAAEWVGVDGAIVNSDLIQAGVDESENYGLCDIKAWWEILPDPSVDVPMTVHSGDQVRVSIHHEPPDINAGTGPWAWGIDIFDLATGQDFWQQFNYHGPASTAEWVVEAPTIGWVQSNMMPYQSVTWSNLTAYGRAAQLHDIWLVQNGAEQSVPSSVSSTHQLMQEGFVTEYVG